MKKSLYPIFLLMLFIIGDISGQCPAPDPPPVGNCPAAGFNPICQGLTSYCASLLPIPGSFPFPGCPANVLNNPQYVSFIAGTPSITFTVTAQNCQNNAGLHGAVYSDCAGGVVTTFCPCTTGTATLSGSYVVGQQYWVVVDGCAGDVCEFVFNVVGGSTAPPSPGPPGDIIGETLVCPNTIEQYLIPPPNGASIYEWTLVPAGIGNILTPPPYTEQIEIAWVSEGTASLCVQAGNACELNPNISCIDITVEVPILPPIDLTLCLGEVGDCAGTPLPAPGMYQIPTFVNNGCAAIQECNFALDPNVPVFEEIDTTICGPGSVTICGEVLDESGLITIECESANGCPFTTLVDLAILEPMPELAVNGMIDCGANSTATVSSTSSTLTTPPSTLPINTSYTWTGPGIVGATDEPEITVNAGGEYCLIITEEREGITCPSEQICATVIENTAVPDPPSIDGNLMPCAGTMQTYTASNMGITSVTGYSWNTPNGEPIVVIDMSSVSVTWGGVGMTQICATADNDCGSGMQTCMDITIIAQPNDPVIEGPAVTCNGNSETYSVNNTGTGTYDWTAPMGAAINGSGNSIMVDFSGAQSGDVCVTFTNDCGTSPQICTPVTVNDVPAVPTLISGATTVCNGEMVEYCLNNDPSADSYTWTGANGNFAGTAVCNTIDWTGANNQQVCVVANNDCGASQELCFDIIVNDSPTANISGMGEICENSNETVDLNINLTGLGPWTLDYTIDGANPTTLNIDNSPFVLSVDAGGTYELSNLSDQSSCNGLVSGTATVTENQLPTATISGGGAICEGSGSTSDINIDLTGSPNWTVEWTLDGVAQASLSNIDSSPFTLSLSENQAGEVMVTSVTDGNNCTNVGDGSMATVVVNDAPVVSQIMTTCNLTNTAYVVEFVISGGDPSSYQITPNTGTLSTTAPFTFTSDPIPNNTGYNFVVSDANNCPTPPVEDDIVACDCTSQAGEMDLNPVEVCGNMDIDLISLYNPSNQVLDGDDAITFYLHSGAGISVVAPIFQSNPLAVFSFDASAGMQYGVTYYVSAAVGNELNGEVDLNDVCTDVAQGTPITFFDIPTADLSGDPVICDGDMATLTIDFTGIAPWTIEYDDGSGTLTEVSGISSNPFSLNLSPNMTTTYTLASVADNHCDGTVNGTSTVTVNTAVTIANEGTFCNNTGTGYNVTFEILGGDPTTYTVNGSTDGIVIGNPTVFTSQEIPAGDGFSFTIDDINSCEPVLYEDPMVECVCLTAVGSMDGNLLTSCGNGPIDGIYDNANEVLDGNDLVQYVLKTGSGANLQNIVSGPSNTSSFTFDGANMEYGTTYYIVAFAGSDDGTGNIAQNDPCLVISTSTPVVFFEIPTATISGDTSVCINEPYAIEISFTGDSPYEIVITGGPNDVTISDINNNPYTYIDSSGMTTIYSLVSVTDENCPGTVDGTALATINEVPNTSNPQININANNTGYTVSFEISGGDPSCYDVTGNPGTLVGNVFTSDEIACGTAYSFFVDDCNTCGPIPVEGLPDCPCITQVGEMDTTTPLSICGTDPITANYTGLGENLDGNDVIQYIIHNGDNMPLSTNDSPEFAVSSVSFDYGTTYFISAIAGDDNGNGSVLMADTCLSISVGVPVIFNELPTAILSGEADICPGEPGELTVEFTGDGPFEITYQNVMGVPTTISDITDNPYTLIETANSSEVFNLTAVSNPNCDGNASGFGTLNVAIAPSVFNIFTIPDTNNVNYVVVFGIAGGDPDSYIVAGDPGSLNGSTFTSDPIPCGSGYSFSVSDANNCPPIIVEQAVVECPCITQIGVMNDAEVIVCEGAQASVFYDDLTQVLDGNDAVMFALHTGSLNQLGNVIQTNSSPVFDFDDLNMQLDETYYISAVGGDDDGSGLVDLQDPCLSVAQGTPVVWVALPTIQLTANQLLCEDETTFININPTGTGPWALNYNDVFGQGQSLDIQFAAQAINFVPPGPGTFTLTALSIVDVGSGCGVNLNDSITIVVNEPANPGNFNAAARTCEGSGEMIDLNTLLDNADQGGSWTNELGIDVSNMLSTSGLAAGTYEFTYTVDSPDPCPPQSEEVEIIIDPLPIADAGADLTLTCDVTEVCLGGENTSQGDFSYQWSTGATEDELCNINTIGDYGLTVTNNITGCSSNDEVSLLEDLDQPVPNISVAGASCFGESDGFISVDNITGGLPPYTCSFNGGAFNSQTFFPNLSSGMYEIVCKDAKGCEFTTEVSVQEPPELNVSLIANFPGEDNLISLGDSLQIQVQVTLPFDSIDAIIWTPSDAVSCDTCEMFFIQPEEELSLTVTIQEQGCSDSDALAIFVSKDRNLFAPNVFSPNNDGTNDFFQLFAGQSVKSIESLNIFNRWGEVVYSFQSNGDTLFPPGWDGTYRGETLNPAVFTWFAEVKFLDDVEEIYTGDVTLVR